MAKDRQVTKDQTPPTPAPASALLRDALSRVYDARTVYGEPVIVADRAIIPAARVSAGAGGGFGADPSGADGDPSDEGAGLGHGVHARPAGFIDVTPEGARWVSAVDVGAIVIATCVTLVLVVFALRRRGSRCCGG
jgi:uncharacterized spore protein YtfJ